MTGASASNPILELIDAAIAGGMSWLGERISSREGLAKAAGLSRDIFRKLEERGPAGTLKIDSLQRIAVVSGIDYDQLVTAATQPIKHRNVPAALGELRPVTIGGAAAVARDVPIRGTAAGSAIGSFQITTDVIDYVPRPPALAGARDIYALYVQNDSMYPMYSSGHLVFVHPHKPIAVGDGIILQIQARAGAQMEAYIKSYKSRTAEHIIAEQFNPAGTIHYKRETVIATHKVLTMNELFGA